MQTTTSCDIPLAWSKHYLLTKLHRETDIPIVYQCVSEFQPARSVATNYEFPGDVNVSLGRISLKYTEWPSQFGRAYKRCILAGWFVQQLVYKRMSIKPMVFWEGQLEQLWKSSQVYSSSIPLHNNKSWMFSYKLIFFIYKYPAV